MSARPIIDAGPGLNLIGAGTRDSALEHQHGGGRHDALTRGRALGRQPAFRNFGHGISVGARALNVWS